MKRIMIPVFLNQRGCPYRCIYCRQSALWPGSDNQVAPAELSALIDKAIVSRQPDSEVELAFYGGSFTGLKRGLQTAYLAAAFKAKKEGRVGAIRLSTRPDLLGAATRALLQDYGVDTVEVGAQSLVDTVLTKSRRSYQASAIVDAVTSLKADGFQVGIQLMCGLPGDTLATHRQSVKRVVALKPDFVRLYPTLVFADTPLAELYQRDEYRPLSLEQAVDWCVYAREVFEQASIKIIRMGLHLSLDKKMAAQIIAGPAHSAFGQLVKSRSLRYKIEDALNSLTLEAGEPVSFTVPNRLVSDFLGVNKREYASLSANYPRQNLSWVASQSSGSRITINSNQGRQEIGVQTNA